MKAYSPQKIEPKWQKIWEEKGIFSALDFDQKPKKYLLFEFPYPSGDRLHVGHARSYTALDAMARKARMEGYNVLLPMGWDAFGLPTENYAIKNKISPQKVTVENIANSKKQAQSWGLSIDWNREINTTDPDYYKWTQWIFIQLFKHGLAYRAKTQVNWCPSCKTTLANEEVLSDGTHERCGFATEKREQEQWVIKITAYADRLIDDLAEVDFLEKIKTQQINWIGRSLGINISYNIEGLDGQIAVYTTRPDTNFGATFIVVAPESDFVKEHLKDFSNQDEISKYIEASKKKTDIERIAEGRKKTGVNTGLVAINHLTDKKMPIYVSDFVLATVGTGCVIGVPGHDIRDFEFATEKGLEIIRVVVGSDGDTSPITKPEQVQEEKGKMINSGFLDGMDIHEATTKIMDYIEEKGWGKKIKRYHLRDWIFSRQHYWGEPIPLIFCNFCKKSMEAQNSKLKAQNKGESLNPGWFVVPEEELPVKLPELEHYEPSGTGESPLAKIANWVNVKCPRCGGEAKRETDTMPNWAGSNWYYLGYLLKSQITNSKSQTFFNEETTKILKYWMPVDLYNGGMEHTTLHLLYSRFIYKFLYDIGVVPTKEPYAQRRSHGMILGPDRQKMSKSRGNVVNPDEIVAKHGADAFRLYEAFIGPFDQTVSWSDESLAGCSRFLSRVWSISQEKVSDSPTPPELLKKLHKTIKKVGADIDEMKFNTAVAAMMEFVNDWQKESFLNKKDAQDFLKILSPFAPHITEELWEILEGKGLIAENSWPKYDESLIKDTVVTIVIQENGKLRGDIEAPFDSSEEEISAICQNSPKFTHLVENTKKVIYVKNKLINFVK
ncbi:leucine--tRNA ligase [Candidatus Microgenomates bacterium]|nr:leucine--tRNA ligase [Candidatus Microgenomates bacterium]